ncbi:sortase [Candidatus Viridilinea mediisalina]|uniref:Sortase n=1 Tax=Candidatus Viridilinea mediisalina TaxID=2024553 RepID=A0A2A6RMJ4_9CHLR|nr:sortase [Candidatus Viridilinea mediisalina]PDW04163.1 hypothetical protein CJ255_04860 [Candidatus Viridilinea mediisalina]
MFQFNLLKTRKVAEEYPYTLGQRVQWTLSNLLILAGFYLLLYVGGMYAYIEHQRAAARGDSELEVSHILVRAPSLPVLPTAPVRPDPISSNAREPVVVATQPNNGQLVGVRPEPSQIIQPTSVERVILPSILVDAKVIEVGWDLIEHAGELVSVWQVAEFAVGQHKGSANPGEGGNIVLAGHVGGYGQVFRDLFYVLPGDEVVLHSNGQVYHYTVSERLIVDEEGPHVTTEQRHANAQLIAPTDHEVVTLVTCWPASGPDKFTQRVIIRAVPNDAQRGG